MQRLQKQGINVMAVKSDETQYVDSSNLRKRGNLHQKYANKSWFGWVNNQLNYDSGDHVLDVGCGAGWFWKSVADTSRTLNLTLVDSSQGMLSEAKELLSNQIGYTLAEIRCADAVDLPFEDNSFDHVVAMHMLYHVSDVDKAVSELYRVLRPGGSVAVTTNSGQNLKELYGLGSQVFGGSDVDPVLGVFNSHNAISVISQFFEKAETCEFHDSYRINDGQDILNLLTSFPPGSRASTNQIDELARLINATLTEKGGFIQTPREIVLVTGKKPN